MSADGRYRMMSTHLTSTFRATALRPTDLHDSPPAERRTLAGQTRGHQ